LKQLTNFSPELIWILCNCKANKSNNL